jgi:hypothetical protein
MFDINSNCASIGCIDLVCVSLESQQEGTWLHRFKDAHRESGDNNRVAVHGAQGRETPVISIFRFCSSDDNTVKWHR